MLTADLVKVRRRKGRVELVPRAGRSADEIAALAGPFVEAARALEGAARAELVEALDDAVACVDDVRLGRALKKLVLDACDFGDADVDCAALRAEVFARAAARRRDGCFTRAAVLAEVGEAHGLTPDELDRRLFLDLKDAQRVRVHGVPQARALATALPTHELQALLLRAERARFVVEAAPADVRAVLRALKLHQLLFDAEPTEDGLALEVEGPMGMFQQSTRYGLKLAMVAPVVLSCRRARLEARIRLRKTGGAELLVHEHEGAGTARAAADELPEHVRGLMEGLARQEGPWRPRIALEVLSLPGQGALVPDLVVEHTGTGEQVFVEVLGYWSREAVWRRVQWVERGLPFRVVFCVSDRLRVSEAALPEDAGARLLVFKGVIPVGRLIERLDAVTGGARVTTP